MGIRVRGVWTRVGLTIALAGCSEPSPEPVSNTPSQMDGDAPNADPALTASAQPAAASGSDVLGSLFEFICKVNIDCPWPNDDILFPRAYFQAMGGDPLANCLRYYSGAGPSRASEYLEQQLQRADAGALEIDLGLHTRFSECHEPLRKLAQLITPKTPLGGTCQLHAECIDGYCATDTCPGVCKPRYELGGPCDYHDELCQSGLCSRDGLCAERPTPSTGLSEGEACSILPEAPRHCAPGLWCNEAGVCQRPIAALAACSGGDDVCVDEHICLPNDADEDICTRIVMLPLGAACVPRFMTSAGEYQSCDVLNLENCVDGICARLPEGKAGDPCVRNEMRSTCAAGHYCDGSTVTCIADTPLGASCSSSDECECVNSVCSDIHCDGALE